jgi:hypothetical protein
MGTATNKRTQIIMFVWVKNVPTMYICYVHFRDTYFKLSIFFLRFIHYNIIMDCY